MKVLLAKLVLAWLVLVTCCRAAGPMQPATFNELGALTTENMLRDLIEAVNINTHRQTSHASKSYLTLGTFWPVNAEQIALDQTVRQLLADEKAELVLLGKHRQTAIFGLPWPAQWNDHVHFDDHVLLLKKMRGQPLRPVGFANTPQGTGVWLENAHENDRLTNAGRVNRGEHD
ncbi:uncharacterized protein SRS1_25063 [Sporisorium reilianum f. sp. reilianum]|uniref:Uncharacterized protein n=1 Tax=Sporisorium reilianum f. sp. reilianum TaxID=72559 RepID=A0A2N8UMI5_9BASI|nr:uncharacterized protein SRS1_25063 [Sporisorium reilianum f. sp. reilianum]